MRFALHLFCLGLAFELFACGDSTSTTTTIERPELLSVQPSDFLGQLPCSSAGVQSYVATLFDVTPDEQGRVQGDGVQLPSSPATTCLSPVTFSLVRPKRRYLARVDGYEALPTALTPLGGVGTGARWQGTVSNNAFIRVAPGWTTLCGGYPPSPDPDAGLPIDDGAAGSGAEDRPGVLSYSGVTQTPHNCGKGLQPFNTEP